MITLRENEQILTTLHKHWVVIALRIAPIMVLGALPFIAFFFSDKLAQFIEPGSVFPLLLFLSSLYWLFLLLFFFIEWLDYWLDAWIVTNVRVVQIEQVGLFRSITSEFILANVQDVTVETPSMMGVFFKFGNITVQTAGEVSFTARTVPAINETKNLIMQYSEKNRAKPL